MKRFNSILIVDDDPVSNYMTEYFLRRYDENHQISVCRNGKEALRYLNKNIFNPPALILLDVHMPVMDGFEFLESFSNNGFDRNKTRIILYTINPKEFHSEKAKYGIEVIEKPLTIEKFFQAVGVTEAMNG